MTSAQDVMAKLASSSLAPKTFQARVSLQLKMRSFPWTSVNLDGTLFYESPNHLVVRFANVPGYMSGLSKAYAKVLNVGAWPDEYDASLAPSRMVNGHTDVVIELTPKTGDATEHGVAVINPLDWTVEEVTWRLSGGISITISETYTDAGIYRVPASQVLSIHTPYATADGNATLADYVVDVPIDSQIFTQE